MLREPQHIGQKRRLREASVNATSDGAGEQVRAIVAQYEQLALTIERRGRLYSGLSD